MFTVPGDAGAEAVVERARVEGSAVLAGWRVGRSGRSVMVRGLISCLHGEHGNLQGFAVVMSPVQMESGRPNDLEPAPLDSAALVAEAIWTLNEPVYVLDEQMNYVYANKRCETMWGVPLDEMVGRHILEVFPQLQIGRASCRERV